MVMLVVRAVVKVANVIVVGMSALLKCFLGGRNGSVSGVGGVLVVVIVLKDICGDNCLVLLVAADVIVAVVIWSIFINCVLVGGISGIVSEHGIIVGCSGSSLAMSTNTLKYNNTTTISIPNLTKPVTTTTTPPPPPPPPLHHPHYKYHRLKKHTISDTTNHWCIIHMGNKYYIQIAPRSAKSCDLEL